MAEIIPDAIRGQKYISLVTYRKNGEGVATPVWFGEQWNKIYVMTTVKSGKFKRLCRNPSVKLAACTIRGQVTGPEFAAKARILPARTQAGAANHQRQVLDGENLAVLVSRRRFPGTYLRLVLA